MKLAYTGSSGCAEMDMSPMIDMVFLLLIFFIVTSQVVHEKPAVEIPSAGAAVPPSDITNRLMISVKKDGTYFLGADFTPRSLEDMVELIQGEIVDNPDVRILIRADELVEYRMNEKIVTACAKLGAHNMIYSAFQE